MAYSQNPQTMYIYDHREKRCNLWFKKLWSTEAESLEADEITSNEIILEIYLEWPIRWLLRDTRYALCTRN